MRKYYYEDAYMKDFTARVVKQGGEDGRSYVVLDKTCFYPTGGGQPHDTGNLNGVKIVDVEEVTGEIRHYIEETIHTETVVGEIDWQRRFDHMQQHAGQHILSAAFQRLYGFPTVGFHLGKEWLTIDLATSDVTKEQCEAVEDLANEIIQENRPIQTIWVEKDDLDRYPLTKQPTVDQDIRLVIIPEFDYNPCGGTHPKSTGEVGVIKVLEWEKQRGNVRLTFLCGDRVRKQYDQTYAAMKEMTRIANVPEEQLVGHTKMLVQQHKLLDKQMEELKKRLLSYEAKELITLAEKHDQYSLIMQKLSEKEMKDLQFLTRQIVSEASNRIVVLFVERDGKVQFVCGCGADVPLSMNTLAQRLLKEMSGKGGGNANLSQGGGELKEITVEKLLQIASHTLKEMA